MPISTVLPRVVEYIPEHLEDGVLYISKRFRTCSHRCCCGCGEEVVTPLSAAEWALTMEGSTASLWPSIGNWNYGCQSHYVIRKNRVLWAKPMTARQIASIQIRDEVDLVRMIERTNSHKDKDTRSTSPITTEQSPLAPMSHSAIKRAGELWRLVCRFFTG